MTHRVLSSLLVSPEIPSDPSLASEEKQSDVNKLDELQTRLDIHSIERFDGHLSWSRWTCDFPSSNGFCQDGTVDQECLQ